MINKKDILIDMHTHSIFSEHAYSTIDENIREAINKGLKYMVVSDHFLGNGDIIDKKNEIDRIINMEGRINRSYENFKIIGSAEFNLNQEIDGWDKLSNLKWKPIGLHNWFIKTTDINLDDLYNLFINSYKKYNFNCFTHIDREFKYFENGKYLRDNGFNENIKTWINEICIFAKKNGIFLEINESSLVSNDCGSMDRIKYLIKVAKEKNIFISLGSDAHYCKEVGDFTISLQILNEVDFPKKLILNCDEEMIKTFI